MAFPLFLVFVRDRCESGWVRSATCPVRHHPARRPAEGDGRREEEQEAARAGAGPPAVGGLDRRVHPVARGGPEAGPPPQTEGRRAGSERRPSAPVRAPGVGVLRREEQERSELGDPPDGKGHPEPRGGTVPGRASARARRRASPRGATAPKAARSGGRPRQTAHPRAGGRPSVPTSRSSGQGGGASPGEALARCEGRPRRTVPDLAVRSRSGLGRRSGSPRCGCEKTDRRRHPLRRHVRPPARLPVGDRRRRSRPRSPRR